MSVTARGALPVMLQTIDREKKRMPSVSQAQQEATAIAEHEPSKLNPENRGLLKMTHQQLHEFASTPREGLPEHVRAGKRIFSKKRK